jgi:hypothetical protein
MHDAEEAGFGVESEQPEEPDAADLVLKKYKTMFAEREKKLEETKGVNPSFFVGNFLYGNDTDPVTTLDAGKQPPFASEVGQTNEDGRDTNLKPEGLQSPSGKKSPVSHTSSGRQSPRSTPTPTGKRTPISVPQSSSSSSRPSSSRPSSSRLTAQGRSMDSVASPATGRAQSAHKIDSEKNAGSFSRPTSAQARTVTLSGTATTATYRPSSPTMMLPSKSVMEIVSVKKDGKEVPLTDPAAQRVGSAGRRPGSGNTRASVDSMVDGKPRPHSAGSMQSSLKGSRSTSSSTSSRTNSAGSAGKYQRPSSGSSTASSRQRVGGGSASRNSQSADREKRLEALLGPFRRPASPAQQPDAAINLFAELQGSTTKEPDKPFPRMAFYARLAEEANVKWSAQVASRKSEREVKEMVRHVEDLEVLMRRGTSPSPPPPDPDALARLQASEKQDSANQTFEALRDSQGHDGALSTDQHEMQPGSEQPDRVPMMISISSNQANFAKSGMLKHQSSFGAMSQVMEPRPSLSKRQSSYNGSILPLMDSLDEKAQNLEAVKTSDPIIVNADAAASYHPADRQTEDFQTDDGENLGGNTEAVFTQKPSIVVGASKRVPIYATNYFHPHEYGMEGQFVDVLACSDI